MNEFDFEFWLENNYPTTIVNDRYSGTYSGGLWTCWPLDWWDVPEEIEASDPECELFWNNYDKSTVGIGSTPDSAMMDLELKLTNKIYECNNSKRPV